MNIISETDPIKKLACMNIPEDEQTDNTEYTKAYIEVMREVIIKSHDITPKEREILLSLFGFAGSDIKTP